MRMASMYWIRFGGLKFPVSGRALRRHLVFCALFRLQPLFPQPLLGRLANLSLWFLGDWFSRLVWERRETSAGSYWDSSFNRFQLRGDMSWPQ